jgi:hypothetical protein
MIRFAIGLIVLRRDARLLCPTILFRNHRFLLSCTPNLTPKDNY